MMNIDNISRGLMMNIYHPEFCTACANLRFDCESGFYCCLDLDSFFANSDNCELFLGDD